MTQIINERIREQLGANQSEVNLHIEYILIRLRKSVAVRVLPVLLEISVACEATVLRVQFVKHSHYLPFFVAMEEYDYLYESNCDVHNKMGNNYSYWLLLGGGGRKKDKKGERGRVDKKKKL